VVTWYYRIHPKYWEPCQRFWFFSTLVKFCYLNNEWKITTLTTFNFRHLKHYFFVHAVYTSPPKTCRIILSNLPQLFSSELSTQSICPSHTHFLGIHWPILHLNWSELQVTAKEIKTSDYVKTRNKVYYKIYNILFYTFTYCTCFVYWLYAFGLFNNAVRSSKQTIMW